MKINNINGKAYIQIKQIEDIETGVGESIWKITLIDGTEIITKKLEVLKESDD